MSAKLIQRLIIAAMMGGFVLGGIAEILAPASWLDRGTVLAVGLIVFGINLWFASR